MRDLGGGALRALGPRRRIDLCARVGRGRGGRGRIVVLG